MSSRSGWIEDFSGLPSPVPSGQRQRVVRPVAGDRSLARPDVAQDADVLARAGERLGERHRRTSPRRPAGPETPEPEDEAPAREVVDRHRGHRRRGRLARRHLHDRRAELEPLGRRAPPGERRQPVGAVGLRGPDRVEPEPLGLGDRLRRRRAAGRRPSSRCSGPSFRCGVRAQRPSPTCRISLPVFSPSNSMLIVSGRRLETLDHVSAASSLPSAIQPAELARGLRVAVEVVEHDEALHASRADQQVPKLRGPGRRLVVVVAGDQPAEGDPRAQVEAARRPRR